MPGNPLILFSSLSIATLGLLSFVIFLLSFKERSKLHKSLLRQFSLAFFLISWLRIPTLLTAIGFNIEDAKLYAYYTLAFVASTIAYLLFYRIGVSFITNKKFWLNIFPVIAFAIFVPGVIFSLVFLEKPFSDVLSIVYYFYYAMILFLIVIFTRILNKRSKDQSIFTKAGVGMLVFIAGWIMFLISSIYLHHNLLSQPVSFWFAKLFSLPQAYFLFSVAQLMLLLGFLLMSFHEDSSRPRSRKLLFAFGISSLIALGVAGGSLVLDSGRGQSSVSFISETSSFITVNENIIGKVQIDIRKPVNAFNITMEFPSEALEVIELSKEDSIIKLWIQEPFYSNTLGRIGFSGIIPGGFRGEGEILGVVLKSKGVGQATINFAETEILAHDGMGTQIEVKKKSKTYYIRDVGEPSPTLDPYGTISFRDISIFLFQMGKTNNKNSRFDFNADGEIDLIDLSIFISFME